MRSVERLQYIHRLSASERNQRAELRSFLFIVGLETRTLCKVEVTFILQRRVINRPGYTPGLKCHANDNYVGLIGESQ